MAEPMRADAVLAAGRLAEQRHHYLDLDADSSCCPLGPEFSCPACPPREALSEERLDGFRALAGAAVADPWTLSGYSYTRAGGSERHIVSVDSRRRGMCVAEFGDEERAAAESIVAARAAVPALLAEVDRLAARVAELESRDAALLAVMDRVKHMRPEAVGKPGTSVHGFLSDLAVARALSRPPEFNQWDGVDWPAGDEGPHAAPCRWPASPDCTCSTGGAS